MELSEEQLKRIWQRARVVEGVNPDEFRKDCYGAWIRRCRYQESTYALSLGWVVAVAPEIIIGSQTLKGELLPVQWQNARALNSMRLTHYVSAEGYYNCYRKHPKQEINPCFRSLDDEPGLS